MWHLNACRRRRTLIATAAGILTTAASHAGGPISIEIQAQPQTTCGPTEVTLSYLVTATGGVDLIRVFVIDEICNPVTLIDGDDGDAILEPGELWTYGCTTVVTSDMNSVATVLAVEADSGFPVGDATVLMFEENCLYDLDGDGEVSVGDLVMLILSWGPCDKPPVPCPADFDGDGEVGVPDLVAMILNWG